MKIDLFFLYFSVILLMVGIALWVFNLLPTTIIIGVVLASVLLCGVFGIGIFREINKKE